MLKLLLPLPFALALVTIAACDDARVPIRGDADADSDADEGGDADSDTDADADSDADVDGDADGDADTDAEVDADGDTEVDADPDRATDADPEAPPDADLDAEADAEGPVDAEVDGDAEGLPCGDGVCAPPDEDALSCPADCPARCGDGLCSHDEDGCTCEGDCGLACDDGLVCTAADSCATGVCVGEPRDCRDEVLCTDDACVEEEGGCVHPVGEAVGKTAIPFTLEDVNPYSITLGSLIDPVSERVGIIRVIAFHTCG